MRLTLPSGFVGRWTRSYGSTDGSDASAASGMYPPADEHANSCSSRVRPFQVLDTRSTIDGTSGKKRRKSLGSFLTAEHAALVAPTEALQPGAGPADFESPVYAAPPTELSLALDAMVLAQPRTSRVLGEPGDGPVTYVQRSSVFGFPDYVTVLTLPAPEGATLAAISRSRFGSSDFGVNKARLSAWLKALEPLEQ